MRACARVAFVLVAVSASIGLAGCSAIDDLKAAVSRWFDGGKSPGGRGGVFTDDLPNTTPMIPPEKTVEKGGKQGIKEEGQEQSATAADRREESRAAIRAISACAVAIAYSLARSTSTRNFFTLTSASEWFAG